MKHFKFGHIISLFLIMCFLTGCAGEIVNEHIDDPIAVSGNLDYYAEMNNDTIEEKCVEKHIEVTGEISKKSPLP